MEIDIRRAGIKDDLLISELSKRTFLDTFTGTCSDHDIREFVDKSFDIALINNELQDSEDFYFIAFLNNTAVGYLRIREEDSTVPLINHYKSVELKRIYVLQEYHDKKVGAALMKFALQWANEQGYQAVWLGVWEFNERAKAFYKKWGFTDTGFTHDFPIGDTPQTDHWLIKVL